MSIDSTDRIAQQLSIRPSPVEAVAALLAESATIPCIARYRKEATGSLDEVAVEAIRERLDQLRELNERRAAILKSPAQSGHLTDELQAAVAAAETMAVLEDLYLPFRPKRRTRAMAARTSLRDYFWKNADRQQRLVRNGIGGGQVSGLFRLAGAGRQRTVPARVGHAPR